MNKSVLRLMVSLLVPCLLADPVTVRAFSAQGPISGAFLLTPRTRMMCEAVEPPLTLIPRIEGQFDPAVTIQTFQAIEEAVQPGRPRSRRVRRKPVPVWPSLKPDMTWDEAQTKLAQPFDTKTEARLAKKQLLAIAESRIQAHQPESAQWAKLASDLRRKGFDVRRSANGSGWALRMPGKPKPITSVADKPARHIISDALDDDFDVVPAVPPLPYGRSVRPVRHRAGDLRVWAALSAIAGLALLSGGMFYLVPFSTLPSLSAAAAWVTSRGVVNTPAGYGVVAMTVLTVSVKVFQKMRIAHEAAKVRSKLLRSKDLETIRSWVAHPHKLLSVLLTVGGVLWTTMTSAADHPLRVVQSIPSTTRLGDIVIESTQRVIEVLPGNNLSQIAQDLGIKAVGSLKPWQVLYQANLDVITNFNQGNPVIVPGMHLHAPIQEVITGHVLSAFQSAPHILTAPPSPILFEPSWSHVVFAATPDLTFFFAMAAILATIAFVYQKSSRPGDLPAPPTVERSSSDRPEEFVWEGPVFTLEGSVTPEIGPEMPKRRRRQPMALSLATPEDEIASMRTYGYENPASWEFFRDAKALEARILAQEDSPGALEAAIRRLQDFAARQRLAEGPQSRADAIQKRIQRLYAALGDGDYVPPSPLVLRPPLDPWLSEIVLPWTPLAALAGFIFTGVFFSKALSQGLFWLIKGFLMWLTISPTAYVSTLGILALLSLGFWKWGLSAPWVKAMSAEITKSVDSFTAIGSALVLPGTPATLETSFSQHPPAFDRDRSNFFRTAFRQLRVFTKRKLPALVQRNLVRPLRALALHTQLAYRKISLSYKIWILYRRPSVSNPDLNDELEFALGVVEEDRLKAPAESRLTVRDSLLTIETLILLAQLSPRQATDEDLTRWGQQFDQLQKASHGVSSPLLHAALQDIDKALRLASQVAAIRQEKKDTNGQSLRPGPFHAYLQKDREALKRLRDQFSTFSERWPILKARFVTYANEVDAELVQKLEIPASEIMPEPVWSPVAEPAPSPAWSFVFPQGRLRLSARATAVGFLVLVTLGLYHLQFWKPKLDIQPILRNIAEDIIGVRVWAAAAPTLTDAEREEWRSIAGNLAFEADYSVWTGGTDYTYPMNTAIRHLADRSTDSKFAEKALFMIGYFFPNPRVIKFSISLTSDALQIGIYTFHRNADGDLYAVDIADPRIARRTSTFDGEPLKQRIEFDPFPIPDELLRKIQLVIASQGTPPQSDAPRLARSWRSERGSARIGMITFSVLPPLLIISSLFPSPVKALVGLLMLVAAGGGAASVRFLWRLHQARRHEESAYRATILQNPKPGYKITAPTARTTALSSAA